MGSTTLEGKPGTAEPCRICWESPSRADCFLAVEGEEKPICRACWEQALLDPKRVARRLQSPFSRSRFRTS